MTDSSGGLAQLYNVSPKKVQCYCIPGLGADASVFKNIAFPDLAEIHFIEWIRPYPKESIADYALRISSQMDLTKDMIVIGVSFGGMIAVEISKMTSCPAVIISSIEHLDELPRRAKLLKCTFLVKIMLRLLQQCWIPFHPFIKFFFDTDTEGAKIVLKSIRETDPVFAQWALNAIPNWDNQIQCLNRLRIHGDNDHLLPLRNGNGVCLVRGGHLVILSQAGAISDMISAFVLKIGERIGMA